MQQHRRSTFGWAELRKGHQGYQQRPIDEFDENENREYVA